MSLTHDHNESINTTKNNWHHSPTASNNDYTVLDLLFMWKKMPAVNLSFLLNRAMELVGYRSNASLFYFALGGALDYDYDLATEKILKVASQYGNYFYSFWHDITQK